MKRLGLIGAGNMGGAILRGVLRSGLLRQEDVLVSAKTPATLEKLRADYPGVDTTLENREVARNSKMILLAVKPQFLGSVLTEICSETVGKAVVSIAAGWTMDMLSEALGDGAALLRAMPNTPVLVGEGMTALCAEHTFSAEDLDFVTRMFQGAGKTVVVPERLFDGVIAVSGSSPAYLYMMLEAMGDAGVREGLPRDMAYQLAAQAMLGAAKMLLETGEHPGRLKDAVCSPAGTTIEAVAALERTGFRHAVMEAMTACAEKSRQMAK